MGIHIANDDGLRITSQWILEKIGEFTVSVVYVNRSLLCLWGGILGLLCKFVDHRAKDWERFVYSVCFLKLLALSSRILRTFTSCQINDTKSWSLDILLSTLHHFNGLDGRDENSVRAGTHLVHSGCLDFSFVVASSHKSHHIVQTLNLLALAAFDADLVVCILSDSQLLVLMRVKQIKQVLVVDFNELASNIELNLHTVLWESREKTTLVRAREEIRLAKWILAHTRHACCSSS